MCPGSDSIALPGESTSHRELFELEAVPGETVRPSLLGGSSAAVLWLVVSVCSDFCTVLWHVIRFKSTYYLCGLELAVLGCFRHFLVMRISTPDKAGGLVRPRPPAFYRLAGGQFGPDGTCLFCSFLWAHAKVELVEVRFHFGSGVGTFFELFWDFYVRRVKK